MGGVRGCDQGRAGPSIPPPDRCAEGAEPCVSPTPCATGVCRARLRAGSHTPGPQHRAQAGPGSGQSAFQWEAL